MSNSAETTKEDAALALTLRCRDIEERLATIEAGAISAASGIGFGKRIGEGTNIAVERFAEVSMHDSLRAELETVKAAKARLERGDAPNCEVCGRPIGVERLGALPWALRCVDCAT